MGSQRLVLILNLLFFSMSCCNGFSQFDLKTVKQCSNPTSLRRITGLIVFWGKRSSLKYSLALGFLNTCFPPPSTTLRLFCAFTLCSILSFLFVSPFPGHFQKNSLSGSNIDSSLLVKFISTQERKEVWFFSLFWKLFCDVHISNEYIGLRVQSLQLSKILYMLL